MEHTTNQSSMPKIVAPAVVDTIHDIGTPLKIVPARYDTTNDSGTPDIVPAMYDTMNNSSTVKIVLVMHDTTKDLGMPEVVSMDNTTNDPGAPKILLANDDTINIPGTSETVPGVDDRTKVLSASEIVPSIVDTSKNLGTSEIVPATVGTTKNFGTSEASTSIIPENASNDVLLQIHDTLQGVQAILKAILAVQKNPGLEHLRMSFQECEARSVCQLLCALDPEVEQKLRMNIMHRRCDILHKMVKEYIEQSQQLEQILQVEENGCTVLHVAVLQSNEKLVAFLLQDAVQRTSMSVDHICKMDKGGCGSALAMAIVIGNEKILDLFSEIVKCSFHDIPRENKHVVQKVGLDDIRPKLRNILNESCPISNKSWRDYLQLDGLGDEFCLLTERSDEFLRHLYTKTNNFALLAPLLRIRDGQGRTMLHYFVQGERMDVVKQLISYFPDLDMNVTDYVGRTPLHWAAALGYTEMVELLAGREGTKLNATFSSHKCNFWNLKEASSPLVSDTDMTALHLAVIHDHYDVVECLLKRKPNGKAYYPSLDVNPICNRPYAWNTPFQMAACMNRVQIMKLFLKDDRLMDPGMISEKRRIGHIHDPALHQAIREFHPLVVKALVDNPSIDTLAKERNGNSTLHTALHNAGKIQRKIYTNFGDVVCIDQLHSFSKLYNVEKAREPINDFDKVTCIDLLVQSVPDFQHINGDGGAPTLSPSSPESVQKWWLEKMAKETQENKTNLNFAANAISVTAALVATASFIGPLQPPLGLSTDANQIWLTGYSQVKHVAVEIFFFCDSLSFYLAISSIVFAILPSLPILHEGATQEVRIAGKCVRLAILLLFASIIFVICAFSAANIAIMPEEGPWRYKTVIVVSTTLGVLVCFLTLILSFMRLLMVTNRLANFEFVKKISNCANSILLS